MGEKFSHSNPVLASMPYGYALHKAIFDSNNQIVDYIFIEVNKAFEDITNLQSQELVNKRASGVFHKDNVFNFVQPLQKRKLKKHSGHSDTFEIYYKKENKWFQVELFFTSSQHFAVTFHDISTAKKNEIYKEVIERQQEMVCRYLPDTTLTFVNEAYCNHFGFSEEELLGKKFLFLFPEEAHEPILNNIENIIKNKSKITCEHLTALPQSNQKRWQKWINYPLFDSNNEVVEFLTAGIDITAQKEAELSLKLRESLLEAVNVTAEKLLKCHEWEQVVPQALRQLGEITDVSRIILFKKMVTEDGKEDLQLHCEWHKPTLAPLVTTSESFRKQWQSVEQAEWYSFLTKNHIINKQVEELPPSVQAFFREKGVKTVLIAPIFVERQWWGGLSFEQQIDSREWSESEIDVIAIFTSLLGAAMERMQVEKRLVQAKEEADRANKAKSDFLATISHEIRTPIHGIMGMADLARMTDLSEQQQNYIKTILQSSQTLLDIINDILDYSKIESKTLQIREKVLNLPALLNEVFQIFLPTKFEKDVDLILSLPSNIPTICLGDPLRIRQILLNLLGNAVKFTEKGSVSLQLSCPEKTYLPGEIVPIEITVTDTGIGIPHDRLESIFAAFAQIDSSMGRNYEGTGLGLAISKKLAQLMGGSISVESEIDQGSTFRLQLPLKVVEVEESDAKEGSVSKKEEDLKVEIDSTITTKKDFESSLEQEERKSSRYNHTILITEDNPVNMMIARERVRKLGYKVIEARNGIEAVEQFLNESIDLIFMDLHMPDMDGMEATRIIRKITEREKRREVPIIALTADAMKGNREKCLAAGMDDYITKPFKREDIEKAIACYL
ncbi:ATP-binding protein [Heliorestis convoluta]|uniref:Circadian input-output histidine kinase CikA n=1 Tax=Heliorestis convoluta TaxID=356322 RepID=A0A5Q2MW06_9FIRM|nr:ATP-binding protein [Heliorestis convoluta]QGG46428.1 Multi-sensor hybrid histidine kinase [Heliorestis convoluta]